MICWLSASVRKSGGVNRLEAVEKEPGLFQIVIDRFLREIVDFIVVALVAEDGGVERLVRMVYSHCS